MSRTTVPPSAAFCDNGRPGETYNIGGRSERRNIDVVHTICSVLDELRPDSPHKPHANLITL